MDHWYFFLFFQWLRALGSRNAPEGLHGGRLRQLPRLEPEGDVGGGLCVDNQPDYDALPLHLHHAQERRGAAESDARLRHQCPSQVSWDFKY